MNTLFSMLMRHIYTITIILIATFGNIFGQKDLIDSLEKKLQIVERKDKLPLLNKLSEACMYEATEKCIAYGKEAVMMAEKMNKQPELIIAHRNVGIGFLIVNHYDRAIEHLTISLEISRKMKKPIDEAKNLRNIGNVFWYRNLYDSALVYYKRALDISRKENNREETAAAIGNIATTYQAIGNYSLALEYFEKSLEIKREIGDEIQIANLVNDIGTIYQEWGHYEKALEYYIEAANTYEKAGDTRGVAIATDNIGAIYRLWGDYEKALTFAMKALEYEQRIDRKTGIAHSYISIGDIHRETGNNDEALEYFQDAYNLFDRISDKSGMAKSLLKIGDIYMKKDELQQSLRFFNKSMVMNKQLGNKSDKARTLAKIAQIQRLQGNDNQAITTYFQSLRIARQERIFELMRDIYFQLSDIYTKKGEFKKAHQAYRMYAKLKDSIFSEEHSRKIAEMQAKYETEKKERKIAVLNAEKERAEIEMQKKNEQVKRQNIIIISFICGLLVVLMLSVLLWKQFREKKKANSLLKKQNSEISRQKQEIEVQANNLQQANKAISKQKQEIERKNSNINSSLNYAYRIQSAILPPNDFLNHISSENFIFYRPKDIVSGDFYWSKPLKTTASNQVSRMLIAAADCTGHGVPGAFMSMLSITILNEIVRNNPDSRANEILDILRCEIKSSLRQSGKHNEVKDGLDISLCIFDKQNRKVEFAGANSSLYIVRNVKKEAKTTHTEPAIVIENAPEGDAALLDVPGNRMPIGIFPAEHNFDNQIIEVEKNDNVYLFSDGFIDQLGGPKGRKFLSKNFKQLLLDMYHKPMKRQREILEETFDNWRLSPQKQFEQLDDILIIGFKVM